MESLLALTDDTPPADRLLRDPLAIAHVLRYGRPTPDPSQAVFTTGYLTQGVLTDTAATLLESLPKSPEPIRLRETVQRVLDLAARVAGHLAHQSGAVSPDAAMAAARLAGLGWLAVAACDHQAVERCFADPTHAANPEATQRRHWNLDATTITRRLLARWRLPKWAANTVGFLKLGSDDTEALGAPRELFHIVQAALLAAETRHGRLGLVDHDSTTRANPLVKVAEEWLASREDEVRVEPTSPPAVPREVLVRLLRITARSRRTTGAVWLAESEDTIDKLAAALGQMRAEFDTRVRDAKLESLAEFAAGASHEINNPLAVISGQAQLLLGREADPERQTQLRTIVRQTKRVHELLQGTMQFARPPRPKTSTVHLRSILDEVESLHRPDADAKGVRLELDPVPATHLLLADAGQVRQALGHLVRNAVEAASTDGWVRVVMEERGDALLLAVEDSGPGPRAEDVPHLFDPFFSGRRAGRGRGLGLSVAWRLARLNGGSVRFDPLESGPTRFTLVLPQATETAPSISEERQTA